METRDREYHMTRTRDINVTVNGKIYELAVEPRLLLVSANLDSPSSPPRVPAWSR
jgi:hypothetical protein